MPFRHVFRADARKAPILIKLSVYTDQPEAYLALAQLQQAGIRCMLRNETIHSVLPVDALAIQLWVHEEDEAKARALLSSLERAEIPEEDFRDIGHREIAFLKRQQARHQPAKWLWVLIALLALALFLVGW